MSHSARPRPGSIAWVDLTVPDARPVRIFYEQVVGFVSSPVDMGDYDDFCLNDSSDGHAVAGVCHARGLNANLPAVWLIYFSVTDLEASLARCRERGGSIIDGPRDMGANGRMAVIRDPAGATCALIESAPESDE